MNEIIAYRELPNNVKAYKTNGVVICQKSYKDFIKGQRYQAKRETHTSFQYFKDRLREVDTNCIIVYKTFSDIEKFTLEKFAEIFQVPEIKSLETSNELEYYKNAVRIVYDEYKLNKYEFQINDIALILQKNTGILASAQGCGKTLESLVWMRLKRIFDSSIKKTLFVVQQDLICQWQEEAQRLEINLRRVDKRNIVQGDGDYITYYEYIKTRAKDYNKMFDVIVLDEAHKIKSAGSLRGKAIRSFTSKYKLCLTGTPIKNMIKDLFFMMGWLNGFNTPVFPYKEEDYVKFYREFGSYEFTEKDKKYVPAISNVEKLQILLAPTLLRRTLEETGVKLVDKTIYRYGVNFTEEQLKEYNRILNSDIETTSRYWKLRNILTLYPGNNKISALKKIVNVLKDEQIIIYSNIVEAMNYYKRLFPNSEIANGNIAPPEREKIIKNFKKGYFKILIAGVESMGTGHSLQNCRNVIVTDYGFTASALDQAVRRVYRINSTRNVNIFKLYIKNSYEEQQLDLIDQKRSSSENILDYDDIYTSIEIR